MKKKTTKAPKQSKRTVKDLKPKKDAKAGSAYTWSYVLRRPHG